jgi:predicted nucleotidyltransferase
MSGENLDTTLEHTAHGRSETSDHSTRDVAHSFECTTHNLYSLLARCLDHTISHGGAAELDLAPDMLQKCQHFSRLLAVLVELHGMQLEGVAEFARREDLALVLLFGSRGAGSGRGDSDVDLALLPRSADTEPDGIETRLIEELQRSDLDLLWLPHASPLARSRVVSTAKVLYEDRPDRFRHFVQDTSLRRSDALAWASNDQRYITRSLKKDWTMDKELVLRKLAQLAEYLEQLEEVLETDEATFSRDFKIHRVAERQI